MKNDLQQIALLAFLLPAVVCASAKTEAQRGARARFAAYCGATIAAPATTLNGILPAAHWIWDSGEINPQDDHLLIRKLFTLPAAPQHARAFISASAFADVYINGKLLDRIPVNCDPEFQVYEEYDLSPYLQAGSNIIAAITYNYGLGMHHRMEARAGFFFQCRVECDHAKPLQILSDASWQVRHAAACNPPGKMRTGLGEDRPRLIGYNEKYDASRMPENWQAESGPAAGWENARAIGVPPLAPWNQIVVVHRPPLRRGTALPLRCWRSGKAIIYDFGREVAAAPRIEIDAPQAGLLLELGTGERLNADSSVSTSKRVDFTDVYLTRAGAQAWEPATWRGFRYFSLTAPDCVKIAKISAMTRGYDLRDAGDFYCSDSLLNAIWDIGRNSIRLCAQDTYMDTPWREQTQYIAGDARYLQKYAFYAFGGSSNFLTRYNLLCGAESQRWSAAGAIRSRYPTGWLLGPHTSAYLPDYELEWIIMLGEYFQYFGDTELVRQVYPNLTRLLGYMAGFISAEHGLIKDTPGWIVLDHPRNFPMDLRNEITALNALYYAALQQAAMLAQQALHDEPRARQWLGEAGLLKTNMHRWLWSDSTGLFRDSYGSAKFSPQTQVYALLYGLADDAARAGIVRYITSQGKCSEQSFAYYVLCSVFADEPVWALNYVRSHWGAQMHSPFFNGAWHEAWDIAAWQGDVGSASHAWSSGPTALLPQKVLGAEPLSSGWSTFAVQPHPGDLSWAQGTVPSPQGPIRIEWRKDTDRFTLRLSVPPAAAAVVTLPATAAGAVTLNGRPAAALACRYAVHMRPGRIEMTLAGGRYELVSRFE